MRQRAGQAVGKRKGRGDERCQRDEQVSYRGRHGISAQRQCGCAYIEFAIVRMASVLLLNLTEDFIGLGFQIKERGDKVNPLSTLY